MHTILVAHRDSAVSDLLRMALLNVPTLRGVAVPLDQVRGVLRATPKARGLILQHGGKRDEFATDLLAEIRATYPDLRVLLVGERRPKQGMGKTQRENDVFSFIPEPLEPMDLCRRLHRLAHSLAMLESGSFLTRRPSLRT